MGSRLYVGLFFMSLILGLQRVEAIRTYYMEENCGNVISTDEGGVGAFRVALTRNSSYSRGLNCQLVIKARLGHQLMFYFESFDIKFYSFLRFGTKYSGCIDYITLKDGTFVQSNYIKGFTSGICGISHGDDTIYNSTTQYVRIGFYSNPQQWGTPNNGFSIIFTEFRTGFCYRDEFRCPQSGRCIQESIRCNTYNPCGDHTDCIDHSDTYPPYSSNGQSSSESAAGVDVPKLVGIVVSIGIFIVILILLVGVIKSRRLQSRTRRCQRRQNISFIDSDFPTNLSQLRLPSYEEVCGGAVGPYEATPPPPYMEQDPNKSHETPEGATQLNENTEIQALPAIQSEQITQRNPDGDQIQVAESSRMYTVQETGTRNVTLSDQETQLNRISNQIHE